MATISWTEELSVNIPSIDEQHKKLVHLINEFYRKISIQSPKESIFELIKALKDYTVFHFSTEEKYMKQFDYPGYLKHKNEHDQFVNKVLDFEDRYKNGKLILTLEITNFIRTWVANHICNTDKLYSDFLNKNGVK